MASPHSPPSTAHQLNNPGKPQTFSKFLKCEMVVKPYSPPSSCRNTSPLQSVAKVRFYVNYDFFGRRELYFLQLNLTLLSWPQSAWSRLPILPCSGVLTAIQRFLLVRFECFCIRHCLVQSSLPLQQTVPQGFSHLSLPLDAQALGRERKSLSPLNSSTPCLPAEFFFSVLKKTVLVPHPASTPRSPANSMLRWSALAHREAEILFCYRAVSLLPSLNQALLLEIKNACFQTVSLWILKQTLFDPRSPAFSRNNKDPSCN